MIADDAKPRGRGLESVARAIAALEALAAHRDGLGVNELGRQLGINASNASRLLATLEQGGLVERDGQGPYRIGTGVVRLAFTALERLDVREIARPLLAELAQRTGETTTLSVPVGGAGAAVTVEFERSPNSVASIAVLGRPTIPHATASGKVVLAFGEGELPDEPLPALTPATITDPGVLREVVAAVRRQGWAEARGEREPDLNAVAAPVLDTRGALAAVLGAQGPAARMDDARMQLVRAELVAAAAELSRRLGSR